MLTACLTQSACSAALLAGRPTAQRAVRAPTPASFPKLACRAAAESSQVTGMVFEPFSEVEPISSSITKASGSESFARTDFHPECEAAINEQANIEYNVSYIYHAMWAYFDRDNVGLPGLASWFKENSAEERGHAELLMEYNNKRGGKVQLQSIMAPMTEFGGPGDGDKGDALYAMELALSLEKLNFQKLRALQAVAEKHSDAQMSDFVESDLLAEQVDAVKEVATYVSQLRRVGKGHGVFHFDKTFR